MISKNPFKAIEILARDSSSSTSLFVGVDFWIKQNSSEALDWFAEKKNNLLAEDREQIKGAFLLQEIRSGDFEHAIDFINNTGNEGLRKDMGWHLWKAQKDSVIKRVDLEPEKIANSFLDKSSGYEEYMLEAAVTHWISKEPEKAADWTEANIDQMARGPRQYVAASYAKEAAAQGDMATARQWANLIQDEKTLTRINGVLKKAEEAASN